MLQLLRSDEDDLRPAPGLGAIGELLESAEKSGLTVEQHLDLTEEPLPPVVDLAAYRILQEALTNVARHAGAMAVGVTVSQAGDALEVEVVNAAGSTPRKLASAGVGLLGIRERVALLGGTLETGPTASGGFRLFARLPTGGRSE